MVMAAATGWQWGHSQVMPKCPSLCSLPSTVTLPNELQGSTGLCQQKPVPRARSVLCSCAVVRELWEKNQGIWEHGSDALTHTPNVCYLVFANPN